MNATFTLRNGLKIPMVGLGTYQVDEPGIRAAIPAALDAGYRLFDTAAGYKNESFLGSTLFGPDGALARRGLTRSDVFITSKLKVADQGYEKARLAIDASIERLGTDYIDLYLIHWPGAAKMEPGDVRHKDMRKGSWRAFEEAHKEGKIRSIGVSNYLKRHLEEMEQYANVLPMVNQFELHPLYYPMDVIEYCKEKSIFVQAYASLGQGALLKQSFLTDYTEIGEMCKKYNVEPCQIYLKWALRHDFGIIPKSTNPDRIKRNADLFSFNLSSEDLAYLDNIHRNGSIKFCWDSAVVA
eukprot:Colp12_sorted_trinity150504_noHs@32650